MSCTAVNIVRFDVAQSTLLSRTWRDVPVDPVPLRLEHVTEPSRQPRTVIHHYLSRRQRLAYIQLRSYLQFPDS